MVVDPLLAKRHELEREWRRGGGGSGVGCVGIGGSGGVGGVGGSGPAPGSFPNLR